MARRERAASGRRAFAAHGVTAQVAQRHRAPLAPAPAASPVSPAAPPQLVQGELGLAAAPAELWVALHLPALILEAVAAPGRFTAATSRASTTTYAAVAAAHVVSAPAGTTSTAAGTASTAAGTASAARTASTAAHILAAAADVAVAAAHATANTGRPFAVFEGEAGLPRLVAVDAAARARGVVPGLSLAAALALEPALEMRARDLRRERAQLLGVADAACGFTPRVSLEPPDGVLLEVRGSLGLFGGAAALCEALGAACARLGVTVQPALAPTPLAALLLARAGRGLVVTGPERLAGALAPLPLAVLRWPQASVERLASMGVRTLGEVQRLPRTGFARRFGRAALEHLDRLAGRRADPRPPYRPLAAFRGRCEPAFELEQHDAILRHLEPLLADLERFLRSRQAAVLQLRLALRHRPDPFDGRLRTTPLVLRLAAPEFAAARFLPLLGEYLARLALPAPVIAILLRSGELQPCVAHSASLWRPGEHGGGAERESPALIERLRARLGPEAVYGLCLVDEHRPERAWRVAEPRVDARAMVDRAGGAGAGAGARARPSACAAAMAGTASMVNAAAIAATAAAAPEADACVHPRSHRRPLWLLQAPQPLVQGPRELRLLDGPERIESGWWDGGDVARDYYVACEADGALLWVFRERRPPHGWFLHGVFG